MTAPRPPRLRARRSAIAVLMAAAAAGTACSPERDAPATVTLPSSEATTTTTVAGPPEQLAPEDTELDQPLAVAWVVQIGGTGDEQLRAVVGDQATVVAVGNTTGIGAPAVGGTDALVATIDTAGEILSIGESGSTADDTATAAAGGEAGVIVCGATEGVLGDGSGGSTDSFSAPIASSGNLGDVSQLGGPEAEEITGAAGDAEQQFGYASGTLSGLLPGAEDPAGRGLGEGDALAMQFDANGTPIWARQFGTFAADAGLGSAVTPDGDGVLVGFTEGDLEGPSSGGRDAWVSRFDPEGNQRWTTQLGSESADELRAVTTNGEARRGTEQYVAAGVTDGDVDGDGLGELVGGTDAFVASFSSDGDLTWNAQFGSESDDELAGIAADGATVYVAGTTSGELSDVLPDGGEGGGDDGFVAAIDAADGAVRWVGRFGSDGDERVSGLAITEDGLLVATGTTTGQLGEAPAGGGTDGFVVAFPLPRAGGGAASSV